ncbi:MAG: PQQ-dependent sugar dehydrogenase [bacterium]|nr:PQQ-dependent sugar dehydrogenase [bacterium]
MGRRILPVLAAGLTAVACSGGSASGEVLQFPAAGVTLRVGDVAQVDPDVVGELRDFEVRPALPAGLALDVATGRIAGTPTTVTARQDYVVSARSGDRRIEGRVAVAIGRALPADVLSLAVGYECREVASLPNGVAKMAVAPDGRTFVTELTTGAIRIVDASGNLLGAPFVTVPVLGGGHLGLLGVALSPDFAIDGLVFAYACTPAGAGKPDRGQLLRWRAVGNTATAAAVLLDDLPVSAINNGGALCFDAAGMLLLTIGDTEDPALAQDDGQFAGKVLRVRPSDGGIPGDNPDPSSHVFAKGLRNTFALTLHPTLGGLFAADNGPAADDYLVLLQGGRNFEWGGVAGSYGAATGAVLRHWPDVVAPTGLVFQDPVISGWSGDAAESLYLSLYAEHAVRRFVMSGAQRTDVDIEADFVEFAVNGTRNLPVDVQRGVTGELLVLTFGALYRIDPIR